MKHMTMSIGAAGLLLAAGMTALAEEPQGWKFELTPYAWLAGLEGDGKINGQDFEFDKSASDLLDAVEVGGSLRIGVQYDRCVAGALLDYFSMSTDELDEKDQPQGGSLDSKMLLLEAMVGYRVDGWAEGQSFVLGAGVRTLQMENDLEVSGVGTAGKDSDITDAMVYVLPSVPVLPSKITGLRFNPVLGIGAGDSDLAYELFPQFQYQITDTVAARLGYRRVGWKFEEDGGNELNVSLAGLIAGLGITF